MNDSQLNSSSSEQSSTDLADEFLQKYIPIAEFCALKNIAEDNVIVMIRDGVMAGYTTKDQWFVDRNELTKQFNTNSSVKISMTPYKALKVVVSIVAFVLVIPFLLIFAMFSYVFSAPGFYSDGSLNGHAYAILFMLIAFVTILAFIYFFTKNDSNKTSTNNHPKINSETQVQSISSGSQIAIFTIISVGLGVIGFCTLIWWVLSSIFSGWCNPHC